MLSDGQRTFTYDTANRLTSVTQGSLSTTFRYNGDGDRYRQTTGEVTTDYVLDPVGLAQVLVESANSQSTHYLPGLGQYNNSAWSYYLPDRLGSVRHLVNPAGTPLLSQSYDPFGNVLQQGGTGQSIFGYTGEQTDPTKLVYLRARYYDPAIGRFLTADSLIPDPFRSSGWNRYAYVENNPVRYVDPSGHQAGCLVPRAGNGISEPAQCIPEGGGARGAAGSSAGNTGLNPRSVMLAGGAGILAGGTAVIAWNTTSLPGTTLNETPIIPCSDDLGSDVRVSPFELPPFTLIGPEIQNASDVPLQLPGKWPAIHTVETLENEFGERIRVRRLSQSEVKKRGLEPEKQRQGYKATDSVYLDEDGQTWIRGSSGGPLILFP